MNKRDEFENKLKEFFNDLCEFYEVKINEHRLMYWDHRANLVRWDEQSRLEIYVPTKQLRNNYNNTKIETESFIEDFIENTKDYLTFCMAITVFSIKKASYTNKKLVLETEDTVITLYKNDTSLIYDNLIKYLDSKKINKLT